MSGSPRNRASSVLSRRWLRAAGAPATVAETTTADVQDRLSALPDLLRVCVTAADGVLGLLPTPVLDRAGRLPGLAEFARIIDSLTAVSYFDAMDAAVVPAQRTGAERVAQESPA